jgi:UDP-4-amino-4,6-dideoxy-N-acetyl-beta-L-altrosamine N-acetyltransferase
VEEHLEMVLNWRTKPEVSQYMLTDVEYDIEEQFKWFNRISNDESFRYWVVSYQNVPVGLINLAAIDGINFQCTAGYYIGELDYLQLGALIPAYLYNYVFKEMKFRKIYGEVLGGNDKVLKMHEIHGFRQVEIYRDHIVKNGCLHDLVLVELLSQSWLKQKRYQRYIAEME